MRSVFFKLGAVRALQFADIAGKVDGRDLHPQAKTEVWKTIFACVSACGDFTLYTAVTKSAGNQNACDCAKRFRRFNALHVLGVYAQDFDPAIVSSAGVCQGFVNAFVRILKVNILSDDGYPQVFSGRNDTLDEFAPFRHFRGWCFEAEQTAYCLV